MAQAHFNTGRYMLAIGRNVKTEDHAKLQLYRHTSEMGRCILNMAEGKRQGGLKDVL